MSQTGQETEIFFEKARVRLPRDIRILAYDYVLDYLPEEECQSRRVLGDTDIDETRIRLRASMPRSKLREVLMHEVLHALWDAMNLNESLMGKQLDSDEIPINGLTVGLLVFQRDNPKLCEFLFPTPGSHLS